MSTNEMPSRRAGIARASSYAERHPADNEAQDVVAQLRAEYAEKKIENYVKAVVAKAPPLTPEQRDRLAAIVRAS